ncbi:MAG: ATP synthase F0 subunit A [Gemmatimonadetes bacterium]|jgi:F-type H+-transporting ATPase subunit a|nr:ATP synthase F0 subunit A [Gemmatimonadota bacterium]
MASGTQPDIIGHIMDSNVLELPFINFTDSHTIVADTLSLPTIPSFNVAGVEIDMSITKHVAIMWVASILLITMMLKAFRKPKDVPSGLANFFEAIVLFLRDEVVIPIMGEHGKKYLPFLLTIFFFILFCNLLGLIPYSATATGNISVTAGLAICSFLVMLGAGIANNGFFGYFKSLIPSGVPPALLIILIPVELISLFVKPFALCVRLFANMTGGHVAILVFLGLIIIMQNEWIAIGAIPFAAAIYLLEIFVGFVQAFVFTLLSTVFIGMAAHPDH